MAPQSLIKAPTRSVLSTPALVLILRRLNLVIASPALLLQFFKNLNASSFYAGLKVVVGSLPKVAKYVVWLLVLFNVRSFPFAWHFRVFLPAIEIHRRHRTLKLLHTFSSRRKWEQAEDAYFNSLTPIGEHPLKYVTVHPCWAGFDDIDYYGHLSNSCYAKTLDAARFASALRFYPHFFRAGGWCALAANHFSFIREIPALAKYEIRVSVAAWDHKWFYVVSKFVTKPSKKSRAKAKAKALAAAARNASKSDANNNNTANGLPKLEAGTTPPTPFTASVHIPSMPLSETVTPNPNPNLTTATPSTTAQALQAVSRGLQETEEPDGAILHTIVISQLCYKVGRITIPPMIAMAVNGLTGPPPTVVDENGEVGPAPAPYSAANPPPHWKEIQKLISKPHGGSMKKLREFMKGGWKDVPEGEGRWWEVAMGGEVEEMRVENLKTLQAMTKGMEVMRYA